MSGIPPRRTWQKEAYDKLFSHWRTNISLKALIAACPAAGKTLFTCGVVAELMQSGKIVLAIVLAPTTNIQLQWVKGFAEVGLRATADASNYALRWRKEANVTMTEDNQVIVLTYAQLARDGELIAEMARRAGATMVIGDEIHHADDQEIFGKTVELLREQCVCSLALSGTPFNSTGGALALCDDEIGIDEDGKPIRTTKAIVSYSYGQAIIDRVCRPVEFIKVCGRGEATYRLLSNNTTFTRITDLARQRKADRISILLDPEGEFMNECAVQAVRELAALREAGDKRAGMLVVAKNKDHGALMAKLLKRVCMAEQQPFFIQELYNDTPKAHDRITDLATDTTDIIVSVRMISEGVDVKRLRIGLFATDWMTRMFFIQFVGRFVRTEDRLDQMQFARVIIPAHVMLLTYAREIEEMIEAAAIIQTEQGPGGEDPPKISEFISVSTQAGQKGVLYRSDESDKLDLAEAFYIQAPSARAAIPHVLAIKLAEELGLDGASPQAAKQQKIDWSNRNILMARAVVKRLKINGHPDDEGLFQMVNGKANRAAGIHRMDKLTPEDALIRRHGFLQGWALRLMRGEEDAAQP